MLEATLRKIIQTLVEVSVDTGVADATSAVNHLDDSAKSWPVNAFTNLIVEITGGTGEGQVRKITSNTANSIVPVTNFDTAPDATSTYRIGFFGKMASDITSWGGTALTGRDISLDLKALVDDSIKGILKSIGDAGTAENLLERIGEVQASPTANTVLDRLKALAKLIPIAKAAIFNTALPAAEADILGADITPTNSPSYLRIYVCIAASGVFRVAREVGGVTVDENLNGGSALIADAAYMFTVPWRTGDAINFEYSVTGANILRLLVDEIGGAE